MSIYKEPKVYQRGYALVISLYKFTETLPEVEKYELASQIRRAAVSMPLNISEGYSKEDSRHETQRFLRMAKGSAGEIRVLMDICRDLGYLAKEQHERYEKEIVEIDKMLYGLIQSLK